MVNRPQATEVFGELDDIQHGSSPSRK
jgi:hypothetical protein